MRGQTDCLSSNRCRASCSSSSTCHRRYGRGKECCGCRSGYAELYKTPPVSPPIEYSPGCILSDILNALVFYTKYLHFLKLSARHSIQSLSREHSRRADAGFGSGKP